jgi:hypothetical protein
MKFIRIGDETLRLDLVTHIKEGQKDETLYGRSVRKVTDHRYGWLEVHFVSGEVLKIEGEGAEVLRRILEEEVGASEAPVPTPARKPAPHEPTGPEPAATRHEHPSHAHSHAHTHGHGHLHSHTHPHSHPHAHSAEEPRGGVRHGFGR